MDEKAPNGWVDVTSGTTDADELTPIAISDLDLLIVRVDDQWLAFEDRCSHAGCAFSQDGELDGTTAICYCHGSEFDITTGEVTRPPAINPIRTFRVRVSEEAIEVEVSVNAVSPEPDSE